MTTTTEDRLDWMERQLGQLAETQLQLYKQFGTTLDSIKKLAELMRDVSKNVSNIEVQIQALKECEK